MVGEQYASPPGREAWWVSKLPLQPSHFGAATDPRILDISAGFAVKCR